MIRYIALLRGINVGGNNIIKMVDLKAIFESMGFENVITYIQSGNVIFSTPEQNTKSIISTIENQLSESFNYESKIVLISISHLQEIIKNAPKSFGEHPTEYKYNVLFLRDSLSVDKAFELIRKKEGVDQIHKGDSVLYVSQLIAEINKSYLSKITGQTIYKKITIRNWNTTTKLASL